MRSCAIDSQRFAMWTAAPAVAGGSRWRSSAALISNLETSTSFTTDNLRLSVAVRRVADAPWSAWSAAGEALPSAVLGHGDRAAGDAGFAGRPVSRPNAYALVGHLLLGLPRAAACRERDESAQTRAGMYMAARSCGAERASATMAAKSRCGR